MHNDSLSATNWILGIRIHHESVPLPTACVHLLFAVFVGLTMHMECSIRWHPKTNWREKRRPGRSRSVNVVSGPSPFQVARVLSDTNHSQPSPCKNNPVLLTSISWYFSKHLKPSCSQKPLLQLSGSMTTCNKQSIQGPTCSTAADSACLHRFFELWGLKNSTAFKL